MTLLLVAFAFAAEGTALQKKKKTLCGNGVKDEGEECDDGNRKGGDGCNAACKIQGKWWRCTENKAKKSTCFKFCGDGKFQPQYGEECDDGNSKGGDGCTAHCKLNAGWQCKGKRGTTQECERICGNGRLNLGKGEECDTGVWQKKGKPDGCSGQCKILKGWHCNQEKGVSKCFRIADACGDGFLDKTIGEECDDGNKKGGDGCTRTCKVNKNWSCTEDEDEKSICTKIEPHCTNGILEEHLGEECDDGGHTKGNDGCTNACKVRKGWGCEQDDSGKSICMKIPPTCGNGVLETDQGEECDDGNRVGKDGCWRNCKIAKRWTCEEDDLGKSHCWLTPKECGNGERDPETEQCDDGNRVNGDGCNRGCKIQRNWDCVTKKGEASKCSKIPEECGNGIVDEGETCDDGNRKHGDGCRRNCKIQRGWWCNKNKAGTSKCHKIPATCGDGIHDPEIEECDDGNRKNGDGCRRNCKIQNRWWCKDDEDKKSVCKQLPKGCGNGKNQPKLGEECDDGNNKWGDGCRRNCKIQNKWECVDDENKKSSCHKTAPIVEYDEDSDPTLFKENEGAEPTPVLTEKEQEIEKEVEKHIIFDDEHPEGHLPEGYITIDPRESEGFEDEEESCDDEEEVYTREKGTSVLVPVEPVSSEDGVCGNGIVEDLESCDDGNTQNSDGCDSGCATECGYDCSSGRCQTFCGDGIKAGTEACDSVVGCTANCVPAVGWECDPWDNECTHECGNGQIEDGEECDGGHHLVGHFPNPSCSETCKIKPGWVCNSDGECTKECEDEEDVGNALAAQRLL